MVWVLAALGWMGAGAARGQKALSKVEVVSADTAKVSPGGATFTVPAGWSLETGKDMVVLTPPETDTHVAGARRSGRSEGSVGGVQRRADASGEDRHTTTGARGLGRAAGI